MDASTINIRRAAFERLAVFDASNPKHGDSCRTVAPLLSEYRPKSPLNGVLKGQPPVSRVPMTIRELEILLALAKSSPNVTNPDHARRLVSQLSEYLPESHSQVFQPSPLLLAIETCPWEELTHSLTEALLSLAARHASVRQYAKSAIIEYFDNYTHAIEASVTSPDRQAYFEARFDSAEILVLAVSLVGFMEGASHFTHVWTAGEKSDILQYLQNILCEGFLVAVETAASKLRSQCASDLSLRDWRKYSRRYSAQRRPLGSMLLQQAFTRFIKSCTTTILLGSSNLDDCALLDKYNGGYTRAANYQDEDEATLAQNLTSIIADKMQFLQDGADYLQIGSPWQRELAFSAKSSTLVAFLNCTILVPDAADTDLLLSWLEDTVTDAAQMANHDLATTVLRIAATTARLFPGHASTLSQTLLRFIVQGNANSPVAAVAADCLTKVLNILSQDSVITTLYSLGNVLSPAAVDADRNGQILVDAPENNSTLDYYSNAESVVSLPGNNEEETAVTHRNIIHTIVNIAVGCADENLTALAQSMLLQKIGKINVVVDAYIIQETAKLVSVSRHTEFQLLLKFYARLYHEGIARGHSIIVDAVQNARLHVSRSLHNSSSHFRIYLVHLLEKIVSKGDVTDPEHHKEKDVSLSPDDITPLLKPLGILLSWEDETPSQLSETCCYDEDTAALFRDAWFNIAVHGISLKSETGKRYRDELQAIAAKSPPLVPENRAEILESDVELNIILRRGATPQRTIEQKKLLSSELPERESDIKRLSYQQLIFLNASFLVESLRASRGDCNKILLYFLDPTLNSSEIGNCMAAIADNVVATYLSITLSGNDQDFSAPNLSKQLAQVFVYCCHRIHRVQEVALSCASKIVTTSPSSLCDRKSLFVLLDLLTIMWSSCLENELDEFGWKSAFTKGNVQVELSDNYDLRKRTLAAFRVQARNWVTIAINLAPLDVKGLLQSYLSEDEDDEELYGHLSLGRSFALEMAALIPQSDLRLGAIDKYGVESVDLASDFIAQYTARQEYRFSEISVGAQRTIENGECDVARQPARAIEKGLEQLSYRLSIGVQGFDSGVRETLRNAATLLCRDREIRPAIIHFLVGIPFQIFTKESIKFGISIWLGVIHENPEAESRILIEIAEAWEKTVSRRKGIFDPCFKHPDPFFINIELLPSDKTLLLRQQQKAQDILTPHFRILQFLESHFNAIRLGSPHSQRVFSRMIHLTLVGLKHTGSHPLAREVHFHIILLALKIIQYSTVQSDKYRWKLKDLALSAALAWFRLPPRWSLGGNRLQMKAEDRLLGDVETSLKNLTNLGSANVGPRKSLRSKQELLQILIENERMRLRVWLFPLEQDRKGYMSALGGKSQPDAVGSLLRVAWDENPRLALQIASRFPSQKIRSDVRSLLLNFPEKAIDVPESLEIMLGVSLPSDVSFQLKYLLYWTPVAPIEALTYFLPAYGNHPFILQYAMRALESHSVDVRFYFVPQLVQAVRYDALGYVERYIYETAKLSQLFAHQVIWNMKANAYKDEDSQIPDSIKPTLDSFMERLISSFSEEERDFYEREFSFFNEVTGVSGKLRPFIKKSKPEKKQKIEEELRKIKVEVGVYLPSNPDGVVVGIDRKSGKPMQSHAKAPYMATFRVQKKRAVEQPTADQHILEDDDAATPTIPTSTKEQTETYEVWQSAIFKVGDDCRQDVLALQLIAAFRNVFNSVGLDVWVFPYRVTATAPGCGVIDVLPNSISRDMLGREAVNGLYDYFVSKHGGEESTRFQEARTNFVKSMAAYSVISYLLQFKDRHNGNIMIDDAGHIIHVDFGFCFDIAPGGVRFERSPFKLTSEMVAVMGGGQHAASGSSSGLHLPGTQSHDPTSTQAYRWFESLSIKAFLASRPHANKFIQIVTMMLDSGLPCFKPDTIKNFRDRFVLEKSEREAADYMRDLIRKSYLSFSTKGYDQFQLMTNGIPY